MARPVCVVTGGGRGIGAATCLRLARAGWDICLSWNGNEDAAMKVAAQCELEGAHVLPTRADVSEEADVLRLFQSAATLGPVRGLVNNAGALERHTRVEDLQTARVRKVFDVNLLGALLCARQAVRSMSPRRGGSGGAIVNVSSRAAVLGGSDEYVDYAMAKAGVDTLTVGLAREVAADGIRVNGVRPALIRTDIHAAGGEPDRVDRLAVSTPMRRGGEPDEVAAAICWLMSEDASYITGAILDVSGGR